MTIKIPQYVRNNGSLISHVFLGPKKLLNANKPLVLEPSSNWPAKIFTKELMLTKYKLNQSDVYVNLLKTATSGEKRNGQTKATSNSKPITHLLTNINIYTMDSTLDFDKFHLPAEIISELKWISSIFYPL